jgi:hypothetical protein
MGESLTSGVAKSPEGAAKEVGNKKVFENFGDSSRSKGEGAKNCHLTPLLK